MKGTPRPRTILHVDLDPFFVSVERSLDPGLRGQPVIVGGTADGSGRVAAASAEARAAGVKVGQPLVLARRLCPDGVFRPGDLQTYARVSEEVSGLLLSASRRVEQPSADEAYVDLTRDTAGAPLPVAAAEALKEELQRRLGLDASLGLASSRLAARVASSWARPRGLLLVLPGYEASFLARQPLSFLPAVPPQVERGLEALGINTLGKLLEADVDRLAGLLGEPLAARLRDAAQGIGEAPIAPAAPPAWVQEEALIRDRRTDRAALLTITGSLAARTARRLRPFALVAGMLTVEVDRATTTLRRDDSFEPGLDSEETTSDVAKALAEPMLEPSTGVRAVRVRLSRLSRPSSQTPLFPRVQGRR